MCKCKAPEPFYSKQRRKFGAAYVILSMTVVGFPVALIVWLSMPRKKVVMGYTPEIICAEHKLAQLAPRQP